MNRKYLPKQLKRHPDFVECQDVISVVFDPNKLYSIEEFKKELNKILNREVD